jgi:glucosamine 6-phosphate synthetase-like amidotransferase/phosphosugar isomerase protein
MCGIFGFALKEPVVLSEVFAVLEKLEVHQYPNESKPVGGFGAGVAVLADDGQVALKKVGKVSGSPAKSLSEIVELREARVLVGHVRMPSPEFVGSAGFRETAQPYVTEQGDVAVVSVHNGKLENYKELRAKLGHSCVFESERKAELIDSEVVPHFFAQLLTENATVDKALDKLLSGLEGNNTVGLLHVARKGAFLHFVHKGKTRGLRVWVNHNSELVFCSRKEPLTGFFVDLLKKGGFTEKASIGWQEDARLKLSFPIGP